MNYPFKGDSEGAMKAIEEASSPRKRQVIAKALELQKARLAQYNQGLLTPHDLCDSLVEIWMEAEGMVRTAGS